MITYSGSIHCSGAIDMDGVRDDLIGVEASFQKCVKYLDTLSYPRLYLAVEAEKQLTVLGKIIDEMEKTEETNAPA